MRFQTKKAKRAHKEEEEEEKKKRGKKDEKMVAADGLETVVYGSRRVYH